MKKPQLSVIIPTFNRAKELNLALMALEAQTLKPEKFEILVVNDGSNDDTIHVLKRWKKRLTNLKFFSQKNSGQGKARNEAFKKCHGEIIVFIGDDIYASKNFLDEHLLFHKKNQGGEFAALGLTQWYGQKVNAYMRWLEKGGPQFSFYKLTPGHTASFWFFYSSNISLKKNFLEREEILFDTDFKSYGWEDIELGYRLKKKHKLKLIYHPNALAWHDHWMKASSLNGKMTSIAKNSPIFQKKHPEVKLLPSGLKLLMLNFISSFLFRFFSKILFFILPVYGKRIHWTILSKYYYLRALKSSR